VPAERADRDCLKAPPSHVELANDNRGDRHVLGEDLCDRAGRFLYFDMPACFPPHAQEQAFWFFHVSRFSR
jgi:hypothetical protein